MVLITIGNVHTSKELLDIAFRRANKRASELREVVKKKPADKSKQIEIERVRTADKALREAIERVFKAFPSFNSLPPFYKELTTLTLNLDETRKSLAALQWAASKLKTLSYETVARIKKYNTVQKIREVRREYYGRASSIIRQISKNLEALETARRIVKLYPHIKTDMTTIAIAGYPNVGKTTLLTTLTGATPKIAPYPFTTQKIMLGYVEGIQFVDTPGLLGRKQNNTVEKHALNALNNLAHTILIIIDPTESCGYTLQEQLELKEKLEREHEIPTITIITKKDIATREQKETAETLAKTKLTINANEEEDVKRVLEIMRKTLEKS